MVWNVRRPLRHKLQCSLWKLWSGVIFIDLVHDCSSNCNFGSYTSTHSEDLRRRKLWQRSDMPRLFIRRLLQRLRMVVSSQSSLSLPLILTSTRSGSTAAFCATGCQAGFGKCDTRSPSPSPSTTCGVEGFANVEAYYASSFNLIDTTDVSTCATLCLAEAVCKSYLFNPKLGNCAYLMNSLEQGEFIATSGTDQLFWERACTEAK